MTLSKGWLALLIVAIFALVLVEMTGAFVRNRFYVKAGVDVSCEAGESYAVGAYVYLKLNCNGKEVSTAEGRVVASYINDPGPLTCTLFGDGKSVTCKPRGNSS